MGMGIGSSSRFDRVVYVEKSLPNPNPNNYTIIDAVEANDYLLMKIQYHDCTNYEGLKILMFFDVTLLDLIKQKSIDPHFSDNKDYISPIARFEPTDNGWNMGLEIIGYERV